ncbi:MAG: SIR2 family NAD-dependent protein deacylase [Planctomycetota bacterium]|jgi:NAD-dependent deacetylase
MQKRVVVLSGAGISAESGLRTFRDGDGLWEEHRVEDVATPEAWARDPELVLRFYNERRRQVVAAEPNAAHRALAQLEDDFDVTIITQNIDDLHERAGSSKVLHLHGEILLARSSVDEAMQIPTHGDDIHLGDLCPLGGQLRPHVVWFGEAVPAMEQAAPPLTVADYLIIVGTSLVVYPAANLVHFAPSGAQVFLVDPNTPTSELRELTQFHETATTGVPKVVELLRQSP